MTVSEESVGTCYSSKLRHPQQAICCGASGNIPISKRAPRVVLCAQ
jgi:hypothetical protein